MSALSLAPARFSKLLIPFVNDLLDGDLCKISLISIFFFLTVMFNHDFIIYIASTHIAASETASDDVTHRIFNTDYSCAHFVVEVDENFSLNDGF